MSSDELGAGFDSIRLSSRLHADDVVDRARALAAREHTCWLPYLGVPPPAATTDRDAPGDSDATEASAELGSPRWREQPAQQWSAPGLRYDGASDDYDDFQRILTMTVQAGCDDDGEADVRGWLR